MSKIFRFLNFILFILFLWLVIRMFSPTIFTSLSEEQLPFVNNIERIFAIGVVLAAFLKNNFYFEIFIRKLYLKFYKVQWSLEGIITAKDTTTSQDILKNIITSLKNEDTVHIAAEGHNYVEVFMHGFSHIKIEIYDSEDFQEIHYNILPLSGNIYSYSDIINRFDDVSQQLKRTLSIEKECYTLIIDFDNKIFNPYFQHIKTCFSNANLDKLDFNIKLRENNIEVIFEPNGYKFRFNSFYKMRDEVKKAIAVTLKG